MKLIVYIIYIVGLLIGLFFLNKKIKFNYKDLSINNFKVYLEALFIMISSLLFGKDYFSFSLYLITMLFIYLIFLNKGIKDIKEEDKRVKEAALFYASKFIYILILNIPVFFISSLKIIGFTFSSIVLLALIIFVDTFIFIKKEEEYKIMNQDEIKKMFPNYDINNLYNSLYNTYTFIKTNYMNSNVDLNKEYLSEELFNNYKRIEKENIAKSQKEMFEEFSYSSANLIEYNKENNSFKVELILSYKNYLIDLNGRVLQGTPQFPHRYTYVIEFKYTNKIIILNEKLYNTI